MAVLYGAVFACLHCHQTAFDCQLENAGDRATRRADAIRQRLGWEPGILNGEGDKPKGMHWRTFAQLKARHDAFVGAWLADMGRRLGLTEFADLLDS